MIGVGVFYSQMFCGAHQTEGRTVDGFDIFNSREYFRVIIDRGAKAFNGEFVGESFFAFAAADTENFAILPFAGGFFRIAAVNVDFGIRTDEFNEFSRTDSGTFAASDAEFAVNNGKAVDYFYRAEWTCSGAAAESQTPVRTSFRTA